MSFNAKTISFSVAALLTIAGGVYAFMPSSSREAPESSEAAGPDQSAAARAPKDPQTTASAATSDKVDSKEAPAAQQAPAAVEPAFQAPKKLTQQQLTPPPMTEDEKLQKAAEQESNF